MFYPDGGGGGGGGGTVPICHSTIAEFSPEFPVPSITLPSHYPEKELPGGNTKNQSQRLHSLALKSARLQGFMQEFWLGGGDEILTATYIAVVCVFSLRAQFFLFSFKTL